MVDSLLVSITLVVLKHGFDIFKVVFFVCLRTVGCPTTSAWQSNIASTAKTRCSRQDGLLRRRRVESIGLTRQLCGHLLLQAWMRRTTTTTAAVANHVEINRHGRCAIAHIQTFRDFQGKI